MTHAPRVLHLLNGDATREPLERSGVPGDFAVWADVLHEGPVPVVDVDVRTRREIRARFIADAGWASYADAMRTYEKWDEAIGRFAAYDEVVIWCEHDLFDQLLLIRHLAWFAERELGDTRLGLVCINAFPGMPDFKGLGELTPAQLASLLGSRQAITRAQLELGTRAWQAFSSPEHRELGAFLKREDCAALPFLAAALVRYGEDVSPPANSLGRTERQILSLVASGVSRAHDLFRELHRLEQHFYITDNALWRRLHQLASASPPLLTIRTPDTPETRARPMPDVEVQLSEAGRAYRARDAN